MYLVTAARLWSNGAVQISLVGVGCNPPFSWWHMRWCSHQQTVLLLHAWGCLLCCLCMRIELGDTHCCPTRASAIESCTVLPTSVQNVPWDLMDTCMFTTGQLSHNPYPYPRPSHYPWTAVGSSGHLWRRDSHWWQVADVYWWGNLHANCFPWIPIWAIWHCIRVLAQIPTAGTGTNVCLRNRVQQGSLCYFLQDV